MLTLYPSNRLEDLAYLLQAVLATREGHILQPDRILVESRGMQHWLNLQLAKAQGIAMNLQFPMPSGFIWELARTLLGSDVVPQQSSYRREVLVWRIDALLASPQFIALPLAQEPSQYWQADSAKADALKRFQLAAQMADLFEQYILYRPDWLQQWQQQQDCLAETTTQAWQAWLWRALVAEQPMTPIKLQSLAIEAMADNHDKLPKQLMIFAINTLAPSTLAFFQALAEYCQVHLFHLNPCVQFWGELSTDKARAKQLRQQQVSAWTSTAERQSNPLLANLGQQGKEFFNALQDSQSFEISGFSDSQPAADASQGSVLNQLQQDILHLVDARAEPAGKPQVDDSIVFTSAHSALREIQSLHDYLLRRFAADSSLLPQQVLVMCPSIEDYAPYIDAVFRRPGTAQSEGKITRLPCSIADRNLRDAEPLVNAFVELLQLPNSRFEVSKILDYLRLPGLQARFGFCSQDLNTIEWWLEQAAVHWGLDAKHKGQCLQTEQASAMHTWLWGLQRLLLGFAHGDTQVIYHERLLLPHVEGQQGILLGRLLQLLERLQAYAAGLLQPRTAAQWQQYLIELRDDFFQAQDEEQDAYEIIGKVIGELAEHCALAGYSEKLDLNIVRHYLLHHFSQADSGNHFLTGQITFCSMVPMRSIPFKIIAILGLNDGDFPRQNIPLGFDLMACEPRRQGDRSRRGDDRYLFLEALISAREALYLSYQGKDVRTNGERQPSLILKELMDYLQQGYQWPLLQGDKQQSVLQQQPLHPFSRACFGPNNASYDAAWLRHVSPGKERNNLIQLSADKDADGQLNLSELISFFHNPLKVFAQRRLQLYLAQGQQQLEDAEPFSANSLLAYQAREQMSNSILLQQDSDTVRQAYSLSGLLPESPLAISCLDDWQQASQLFAGAVQDFGPVTMQQVSLELGEYSVVANLPWLAQQKQPKQLLVSRPAQAKSKDDISMWLTHLLATVAQQQEVSTQGLYLSFNKRSQQWQTHLRTLAPLCPQQAMIYLQQLLQSWQQGLLQPKLVQAQLGQALVAATQPQSQGQALELTAGLTPELRRAWQQTIVGNDYQPGLIQDPYFNWFYPSVPAIEQAQVDQLLALYTPLYALLREEE